MTTTVTIKKKQCGPASEITEDIAKKLYAKKGTRILAIVEIKSDKTHEGLDGDRQVDCTIESFEPVVDGDLNGMVVDRVRELHRALSLNRTRITAGGDQALPLEDNEPTVQGVLGATSSLIERDEETGEPTGIWPGDTNELPPPPEDAPADHDPAQVDDPDDVDVDAHLFEGDGELCAECDEPRTATIHAEVPALT